MCTVIETFARQYSKNRYKLDEEDILKWKNDGSGGVSPGAVVDNISIEALPCGMIDELNITFTENSGAPVAIGVIEDANSDVSSYLVEYKANGDEDWIAFSTNAPTFDILDLSYATTYAIRIKVVCDENQHPPAPGHPRRADPRRRRRPRWRADPDGSRHRR